MQYFSDKNGNEIERQYKDYFKELSTHELTEAFYDQEDLIKHRKRQLLQLIEGYGLRINSIMKSAIEEADKLLHIKIIHIVMKEDPLIKEINTLNKVLDRIKQKNIHTNQDTPKQNPLKVESAKQVPIESLFSLDKVKEYRNMISCCCPFHNEKSPSFVIYKKTNTFKCYGCGKQGDAINFYMLLHKVDFRHAVLSLT